MSTATETQVNIELLRTAVEWVEQQDKLPKIDREWDQAEWVWSSEERAQELAEEATWEYWRTLHPDVEVEVGDYYNLTEDQADELRSIEQGILDNIAPRCGTTYCVAGYIAQRADKSYAHSDWGTGGKHAEEFAAELLGINHSDSGELFNAYNSAEQVRKIAERIAGQDL